ncbi:hypothetical protein QTH97_11620 [Variovorax sp. J22R24]|uniref:hypothetical protein n=1 Tax=Variovorax gracilis TaxID=3053502 RepID=UPI00257750F2|nr:hypothetical protein [Variovorax sp. J22R24]MDM0105587.1 hypothetical protein [Variovorax sp. J22R24]
MRQAKELPASFKDYEAGKHRRYGLLFSVNGGAFAIAKLFADTKAAAVLGALTLQHLSVGMILFTVLMTVDIFLFGRNLRSTLPPDAFEGDGNTVAIFGMPGQCVLALTGLLICAGWYLVAWG